ncbi:MAG TPA: ferritin-like domain-containing protein [Polyangiaceae bacterium]|nr:ferritin-like domain-containing protein [Polyangiaceae bacterium]
MDTTAYVQELDAFKDERLLPIVGAGQTSLVGGAIGDAKRMLQIALGNEISVSELAAAWMPTTPELDVKLAFARQAGDEAGHFQLVADRLDGLGFDIAGFRPPGANPLFDYLRSLSTTVERIAAGLFTLESIAYAVNENFMAFCDRRGDHETVRIYREYIQPDEQRHQQLGRRLLAKYASESASQERAKSVVARVLEIATAARAQAAEKMGTACFPGC